MAQWIKAEDAAALTGISHGPALGRWAGPAGSGRSIVHNGCTGAKRRYSLESVVAFVSMRNQAQAEASAPQRPAEGGTPRTVTQLTARLRGWANEYYATRERYNISDALKSIETVAGRKAPRNLTAADFHQAQQIMVKWGLSRGVVNSRLRRLRRALRVAANPPYRWIPAAVVHEAALVEPLKKGRTRAQDPPKIKPVAWQIVSDTIAAAGDDLELATAIELQWWTGARPGEIVHMRRDELHEAQEAEGGIICRPERHKTAHHDIERLILIPQVAASLLRSWLQRARGLGRFESGEQLFRWASTTNYRRAITRLNERHGITPWRPNQIRHSFATRVWASYGPEVAQVLLGHRHLSTTQIYAERDMAAAWAAIRSLG